MICPRCSVAEISPETNRCVLCGYAANAAAGGPATAVAEAGMAAPEPQHQGIVVVAIGEETLARLPWRSPIHRGFLADLITTLRSRQVAAVGVDVLIDQATDPALDARLGAAIAGTDQLTVN